ncbi:MAG: hypothetical protein M0R33_22400 [Methylomonas sp.]|uniref:hypothetical protein n=1 Tax=Methylomonas sp. TaxID=418 RepID=UPI0025D0C153|nr:hypothetical protein [Methylomonas sp.]MCK9609196.1 hypothetical protein [Methylomonas sp.]
MIRKEQKKKIKQKEKQKKIKEKNIFFINRVRDNRRVFVLFLRNFFSKKIREKQIVEVNCAY